MPRAEQIRADLQRLLQETDLDRPLDSLERTVVLAYLAGRDITEGLTSPGRSSTMREWITWADQAFCGSSASPGITAKLE
jgi:hypothetical protein